MRRDPWLPEPCGRGFGWGRRSAVALGVAVAMGGCGTTGPHEPRTANPGREITRAEWILARHPERYPVRVALAEALLAEAARSLDPSPVARARAELGRSLATQESFEAFVMMARVENFAHRFEEALRWTNRAGDAAPEGGSSPDLRLLRFEALIGLGRTNDARALASATPPGPAADQPPFHRLVMEGRVLAETGQLDRAGGAFAAAANEAARKGRKDLAGWAWVQCAGTHLDRGDPAGAEPALYAALQLLPPDDVPLAIHRAEWHEARNEWEDSRRIVRTALKRSDHPLLHQHAWRAAGHLGDAREADRHFIAAQRGFRQAIDAGEWFTLGALARLLLEEGSDPAKALELAESNARHAGDTDALETLRTARTMANRGL